MTTYKKFLVLLLTSITVLSFTAQASEKKTSGKEKNPDKSQVQKEDHEALNVQKMMTLTEMKAEAEKDAKKGSKVYPLLRALAERINHGDCVRPILEYLEPTRWAVTSKSKHKTQDLTHIDAAESDKFYGTLSNGDVVLSTKDRERLHIWNPKNKTIVKTVELPNKICDDDIIVLKDDRIVIQHNGIANIYSLHDMKNPQQRLTFDEDDCGIKCLTQLSNGNIAIGYSWGCIKIFNRADNVIHDFEHNGGYVQKIVELPKNLLATGTRDSGGANDHAVYIWDLNKEAKLIAKYDLDITGMALLSDGKLIVTTYFKIYIFNLAHLPQLIPEIIIEYTTNMKTHLTKPADEKGSFTTTDCTGCVHSWQRTPNQFVMAWQAYKEMQIKRLLQKAQPSCCTIM